MMSVGTNNSDKCILEKRLAKILHVSHDIDRDYINDVLNQLVAMSDNPEDVAEYLSSFVVSGDDNEDLQQFSRDVKKYKFGMKVVYSSNADDEVLKSQISVETDHGSSATSVTGATRVLDDGAAQRREIKLREKEARDKQREEQ